MVKQNEKQIADLVSIIQRLLGVIALMFIGIILLVVVAIFKPDVKHWFVKSDEEKAIEAKKKEEFKVWEAAYEKEKESAIFWTAANINSVMEDSNTKNQLLYGKELIAHTAKYFGPKGIVLQITNGMNCQNCHLDAPATLLSQVTGVDYLFR